MISVSELLPKATVLLESGWEIITIMVGELMLTMRLLLDITGLLPNNRIMLR